MSDLDERARNRTVRLAGHFTAPVRVETVEDIGQDMLLVRVRTADGLPSETTVAVDELEDLLAGAAHVRVWPEGPEALDDHKPWFTFAYLAPDWSAGAQPIATFVESARSGKRAYKNAVGFVLPDAAAFDRARAAARTKMAAGSLLANRARYGLNEEQKAELEDKQRGAERDVRAAVDHAYARVALPMRSPEAATPWAIEEIDVRTLLTAGRRLHERVLEAVAHRVFSTVTPAKLVSLAGLGPDRPWVVAADLVTAFFSYFDFTKLSSAAPLAVAVSTAVADRKLGYVPGFTVVDGQLRPANPATVRFGAILSVGDVDLGESTALVVPELVSRLVEPGPVEGGEVVGGGGAVVGGGDLGEGDGEGGIFGGGGGVGAPVGWPGPVGGPAGPGPSPVAPGGPGPAPGGGGLGPAEAIGFAALRLRLDGKGLFALNRVLSWLREESATLDVEVTVRASPKGEGFDRSRYRNGVREPLDEAGVEVHEELS